MLRMLTDFWDTHKNEFSKKRNNDVRSFSVFSKYLGILWSNGKKFITSKYDILTWSLTISTFNMKRQGKTLYLADFLILYDQNSMSFCLERIISLLHMNMFLQEATRPSKNNRINISNMLKTLSDRVIV